MLFVYVPKTEPFTKQIDRNIVLFTDPLNGAEFIEVFCKNTQDKDQTKSCIGNKDIGKDCMGMPAAVTVNTLDTERGCSTFSSMKINESSSVIIMDMTGTFGSADGTCLQFGTKVLHIRIKNKFRRCFCTKYLAKQRVFSYHNECCK